MVLVDRSNPLVYRGLLPVFAVGSAIVVLGVAVGSHVDGVLSLRPLVALGRISYGVYLFHWPLFLALTPDRTGLSGTSLFALRVGLSVFAAAISHATLERRVRFNWRASEGAAVAWGGLATAAVVVVVMAASAPITAGGGGSLASGPGDWEQRISSAVPASSAQPRLRIAMYGDSTALRTGIGLTAWAETTGQLAVLPGVVELGCGLVAEGEYQFADEPPYPVPDRCDWRTSWSVNIEQSRPDVAVVQIGPWEVTDRRLPHDKVWRHPGDATYDRYLAAQIAAAADLFADRGVPVVWLTSPRIDVGRLTGSGPQATSDPTRMDRLNALIRESVGQRGDVTIVDLAGYLASQPGGELDERLRPDGVHFTEATAAEVATWLAPAILAAA
jgi:lysophospholipase L1-like esterase